MLNHKILLLALIVTASAAGAKAKINEEDVVDVIAGNVPRCAQDFVNRNPGLTGQVEEIRQALVEVNCNDLGMTGVYVDTPSARLILTSEHGVSGYKLKKNGKFKLLHAFDPAKCKLIDPDTRKLIPIDAKIAPILGHPFNKAETDGSTDWMMFVLERPLLNHRPLALGHTSDLRLSTELLMTGLLANIAGPGKACLNFVRCNVHYTKISAITQTRVLETDCSSATGNSGGPVTMTAANGKPAMIGLYSGTEIKLKNGSPWDLEKMNAAAVSLTGTLLEAIQNTDEALTGRKLLL